MTRLIVLTGAPTSSSLEWNEDALSDRLAIDEGIYPSSRSPESLRTQSAQWRQVPMGNVFSKVDQQSLGPEPQSSAGPVQFLNARELSAGFGAQRSSTLMSTDGYDASTQTATQDLDDFYDQSFALYDDLGTSQLTEIQSQSTNHNDTLSSYDQTPVAPSSPAQQTVSVSAFQMTAANLNNVREIPSATYLGSIEPQTMTVNLVVGIMALLPPRLVTVGRRWGRECQMRLLELLVGDDTQAGFEVTVWLSCDPDATEEPSRRSTLEENVLRLRQRDIILLRNVALGAYRGKVHGQSLRRDVTKVDLLYRRQLDGSDAQGIYSSEALLGPGGNDLTFQKTQRVKQWLTGFVGKDMPGEVGGVPSTRQTLLPPDTQ